MSRQVCAGAKLSCSFGTAPSTFKVSSRGAPVGSGDLLAATVSDCLPIENITSFGLCKSLANPQVQAATAAAHGQLTPQPCRPVTGTPWAPGSPSVTINGVPALTDMSRCLC